MRKFRNFLSSLGALALCVCAKAVNGEYGTFECAKNFGLSDHLAEIYTFCFKKSYEKSFVDTPEKAHVFSLISMHYHECASISMHDRVEPPISLELLAEAIPKYTELQTTRSLEYASIYTAYRYGYVILITGSTAEEKAKFVAEAKSDATKIADLFEIQKGKGNSPEWSLNYALGIVRYGYDDLHATLSSQKK